MRGRLVLAAAALAAIALIAFELARGGASYGESRLHDPCQPRADASWLLRGLDDAACRRHETRVELLLDAADSPLGGIAQVVPNLKANVETWGAPPPGTAPGRTPPSGHPATFPPG